MERIYLTLFFFFGYWLPQLIVAQDIVITTLPDSTISLKTNLQIFTDETKTITWKKAYLLKESAVFQPFGTAQFKGMLERGKYAYWLYFAISSLETTPKRIIIRNIGGGQNKIYHLLDKVVLDSFEVHSSIANKERKTPTLAYHLTDIPLVLQPGLNEFLIQKIQFPTFHPKQVNPILFKEIFLLNQNDKWRFLHFGTNGIFFGILLFVLFFSLIQYFQHRDQSFLFFVLYVLSLFLLCSRQFGLENGYFRFYPNWVFTYEMHTLFGLPIYLTYILFIRKILETKEKFPKFNQVIMGLFWGIIGYLIIERITFYFIDMHWAYRLDKFFRTLFLSISVIVLVPLLIIKDRLANFMGIGTLCMVLFTLIGLLLSMGSTSQVWLLWNKAYTMAQIGILLELLFFSLALGYKTRVSEIEKNEAKLALQLNEQKSQNLKKVDQLKDQFFTNITHEFRTPLTVIQGLTQQIQENPAKNLQTRTHLIQSNADNLLHLVNQLLDISKADFKQYRVTNSQQDIIKYLSYLTDSFLSLAVVKKINLSFHAHESTLLMDFDPKVIQILVTNLIGNALKFTPEHGIIKVVVKSVLATGTTTNSNKNKPNFSLVYDEPITADSKESFTHFLSIHFSDTGTGIPTENLPHIFDRFFQADAADKKTAYGTGIGLALVKELMELVGGIVKVESVVDKGSQFTLLLPIRNNTPIVERAILSHSIPPRKSIKNTDVFLEQPLSISSNSEINTSKLEQPRLLIIEDNADVVYYLQECLFQYYEIIVAVNGKEGTTLAFQHIPDIILSDVMMPEMDGYELCTTLKNDARTSHIPIILLTAKATTESKHKGLAMGADAYLIKPFDKKELLLRLENLLLLRQQMQLHLQLNRHLSTTKSITNTTVVAKEIAFLDQLQTTIQQQLSNEFFKTPQLAKAMAMSQTQLYRKIKALTNQSTAQYIKTIRLTAAKNLLLSTDYSIGQIAVEVGFKTQAHFTRSFQEMFTQSPSELRK